MKSLLSFILILSLISHTAEAQLFKKLKDRTEQKIKQRAEQKVVEGISEELARRAMKPLDNAFDEMFRQSYKDQYGKEYDDSELDDDPEIRRQQMNTILSQMYGTVELPEAYLFDYTVDVELTNFGEKKAEKMKMYIDPVNGLFGIRQKQKDEEHIMVFDPVKDQVVLFNEKEGTAMAIPNVMKMASVYGGQMKNVPDTEIKHFGKINKQKKILQYMCEGYEMETEEYKSVFYVTDRLPFNWTDSFGGFAKNMSGNFYKEHPEYEIKGMLMEGTTTDKKSGAESLWEVKKISDKQFKIDCSKYKVQNMMDGQ